MSRPQVSIGRLFFMVALLCVPSAFVIKELDEVYLINGGFGFDLGLWPGLIAFPTASVAAERRGKRAPFLWGFSVLGWTSLVAYVALCVSRKTLMGIPIFLYFVQLNEWGLDWLTGPDSLGSYTLSLAILGMWLATPQLIIASLGGLITRWIWRARWTST